MQFKSAYLKLTLIYVLIVMIISLIFSLTIYNISSHEIDRGLGRQVRMMREFSNNGAPLIPFNDLEKIRTEQLEASNNNLRTNLIYFNILILILSSLFSYFSAKRTMRPIEDMVISQNRFIADASHELKTPLAAMRAEIEVNLRDKKLKLEDSKKLLVSNLEELSKLETLSNALLNLAKYQQDAKLEFKKLSLTEIIAESYEKVEKLAKDKSITVSYHPERSEGSRVFIKGDKQSLIELFVILLENAIKYSPKNPTSHALQGNAGGPKVTISIFKKDKHAAVEIKDRGIGIKASDLPHIFDRFYRADHSRNKEEADGYGLGLSIAKRIVKLHGGKIHARSTLGKGSEFIVELPLSRISS